MISRFGLAALLLMSMMFLKIGTDPAGAFEAYVTQCPHHFPGQANVKLLNGVSWESPTAPASNFTFSFTDAHGYVHYMSHTYHDEDLREAFLVCRYENEEDIRVPIKGRLYNCGTIFQRDPGLTGAGLRTVTAWCASITPWQATIRSSNPSHSRLSAIRYRRQPKSGWRSATLAIPPDG